MKLQIVTPDSKIFDGDIDGVVFQAPHGEIGILPNHAPYFSLIKPGELVIDQKGVKKSLAIGSGFVEVVNTGVIILTDMAFQSNEINEDKMNEAIRRAQETLKNTKITDEEKDKHLEIIEKSLAILRVKQKKM